VSKKGLPEVDLSPVGFTPNYGWPFKPGKTLRRRSVFGTALALLMLALFMLSGVAIFLVYMSYHGW